MILGTSETSHRPCCLWFWTCCSVTFPHTSSSHIWLRNLCLRSQILNAFLCFQFIFWAQQELVWMKLLEELQNLRGDVTKSHFTGCFLQFPPASCWVQLSVVFPALCLFVCQQDSVWFSSDLVDEWNLKKPWDVDEDLKLCRHVFPGEKWYLDDSNLEIKQSLLDFWWLVSLQEYVPVKLLQVQDLSSPTSSSRLFIPHEFSITDGWTGGDICWNEGDNPAQTSVSLCNHFGKVPVI